MAENEDLDVGNRRFRCVVSDVLRGRPSFEVAQRLVKQICGAWNRIRGNGFDVLKVVGLAAAGADVTAAIHQTGGSDFAHLIKLHARPMQLPAFVLDQVNRAAIEAVIDSGLASAMMNQRGPSVLQASDMKRQIMVMAAPAIATLTNSLLGGPSTRVRAPKLPPAATSPAPSSIRVPAALYEQSLLPVAQRFPHGAPS